MSAITHSANPDYHGILFDFVPVGTKRME